MNAIILDETKKPNDKLILSKSIFGNSKITIEECEQWTVCSVARKFVQWLDGNTSEAFGKRKKQ